MSANHLVKQSKLTKGLLLVALLYSLFACLGSDVSSPNRLKLSPKIELTQAVTQSPNGSSPVLTQKRSRFCIACKLGKWSASAAYNTWVRHQLTRFCVRHFTCKRSIQFVQVKTIPASSDEPFLAPLIG